MGRFKNNIFKEVCKIINSFETNKKFVIDDIVKQSSFEITNKQVNYIVTKIAKCKFIDKVYLKGKEKQKLISHYVKIKDIPENLNSVDLDILSRQYMI